MADKDYVAIANQYIEDILSEKIPACEQVKQACQRQKDDLERWNDEDAPYYFVPYLADKICAFIERLPHVKGLWAKQKLLLKLEPWQIFNVTTMFGWIKTSNGSRRFGEAYLEIPRKNGKSILAAAIGLYMFVEDGEIGAEIYSGATSEKQSWCVFQPAKWMAERAEGFLEHYDILSNASNLCCIENGSKFEPLIGDPGDGASASLAICDEFHEHKKPVLYDSMITGMLSRESPLMLVITTAGVDTSSPCYDKRNQICKILDGSIDNENIYGIIYTLDKEDDWTDFEMWKKANPNFGISILEDKLKPRYTEAMQRASKQNINRCKHLNQWMNSGKGYFNIVAWDKCGDKDLKMEDFKGEDCWVGLDLSSKLDITSMAILFKRDDDYYAFLKNYLPEDATEGEDKTHYQTWVKEGWLTTTMGSMVDYEVLLEDLLELGKEYQIQEVCTDPWNAAQLVQTLQKLKITVVEIPQVVKFLSEPMKELDAVMFENKIHHNGDPVFKWMIGNTCGRHDKNDNVFPYKEIDANKYDGVSATLNAMCRILRTQKTGTKYAKKGLTII